MPLKFASLPQAGILFVVAVLASPFSLAGVDEGMAAFDRGEYDVALREIQPAALAGQPRAQYHHGVIRESRSVPGVTQVEATAWYARAANQSDAKAQVASARLMICSGEKSLNMSAIA